MEGLDFQWKREISLLPGVSTLYGLGMCVKEELGLKIKACGKKEGNFFATYAENSIIEKLKEKLSKFTFQEIQNQIDETNLKGKKLVFYSGEGWKSYEYFFKERCEFSKLLWKNMYLVWAITEKFENFLEKKLPKEKVNDAKTYFSSKPLMRAGISKLAEFFDKETDLQKRIDYLRKNSWICATDPYDEERVSLEEFAKSYVPRKKVSPEKEIKDLENEDIVKRYRLLVNLIDLGDEYKRKAYEKLRPHIEELSKKNNISIGDLGFLMPYELNSPNRSKLIEERKKGYIAFTDGENIKILSGKELSKKLPGEDSTSNGVIKGIPASIGETVRGKAQVINSRKELKRFEEGNILVCEATTPEYVPIMAKSKAIITNQGGIMSHSAIMARELGKPCIVGAKGATEKIKDGSYIEVSSREGIIRIINDKTN